MHMEIDSDAEMLPNFWDDGPSLTPRVSGDLFVWRLSQNSVLTQKLSKHSKQSCQTVGFGGQWGLSHNQLFLFSCTFPLDNFCTLFHTKVISYQPLALHLNQILLKLIYQNRRNSSFFDEGRRSDTTAVDWSPVELQGCLRLEIFIIGCTKTCLTPRNVTSSWFQQHRESYRNSNICFTKQKQQQQYSTAASANNKYRPWFKCK